MAHILIIDDSMYQRLRMRNTLQAGGHELLEATNGREGLEMALSGTPDCIILDLVMPDMGGLEVLQTLRDRGATIPVIVHTSDIQETTRRQCHALGAVSFLNKPLKEGELRAAINSALGSNYGKGKET